MIDRIDNPQNITQEEIEEIISAGKNPIIQFSEACYSINLLKKIDGLCDIYKEELEVRFYGHYGQSFDANVLGYLPNVKNLSMDCLQHIENHEKIGELRSLSELSFGVFYFEDKDFLSRLNLKILKKLVIGENKKKNINLSYISECESLEELYIVGHTKNIKSLSSLSKLKLLSLGSIGKKQDLNFVNEISSLESLILILGGRDSIEEVVNENLKEIKIIRVRGLERLGDLSRFTNISSLQIEDQIKINDIIFTKELARLSDLKVITCKSLTHLTGLKHLINLSNLRISGTNLEVAEILTEEVPENLKVFAFYTGKAKKNKEIRNLLDSRGYSEYSES